MVRLVVKAPLADGQVGTRVLDLLDHLDELFALVVLQLLELLDGRNVELVLGLGLGRLKGAGQDGDLGVLDLGRHLGVGEILVDDDALDEDGVLERAADLAVDLDQLKVDVLALEIRNGQHGVDGNVGKLVVRLGDNLAAQTCARNLDQVLCVLLAELDRVGNLVKLGDGNVAGLVVAVGDADGVDALVDQLGRLLEQRTGQDNDTGCSVTNLVVL